MSGEVNGGKTCSDNALLTTEKTYTRAKLHAAMK